MAAFAGARGRDRAGSALGRSVAAAQPAGLTTERFRARDASRRVPPSARGIPTARSNRAVQGLRRARIDDQALLGARCARARYPRSEPTLPLHRRVPPPRPIPRVIRDWRKGGHGWVDMNDAIAESVNSHFYALASDLGIDRMSDYLGRFGFGQPTGIDVPGESAGVLALARLEARTIPRTLVPRRDGDRGHRSRLLAGHPDPARPRHGPAGGPRPGLPPAPRAQPSRCLRERRARRGRTVARPGTSTRTTGG